MEALSAVLEEIAVSVRATLKDLRDRQEADFHILFAALIGVTLGMVGLTANGFRWV